MVRLVRAQAHLHFDAHAHSYACIHILARLARLRFALWAFNKSRICKVEMLVQGFKRVSILSIGTCDADAVERVARAARRQWAHRTRRGTRSVRIVWQRKVSRCVALAISVMECELLQEFQPRDFPHIEVRILVAVSRPPLRLQRPTTCMHPVTEATKDSSLANIQTR